MCAALGARLGLGELLVQGMGGRGRGAAGRQLPAECWVAEATEALLGAVYVDSGFSIPMVRIAGAGSALAFSSWAGWLAGSMQEGIWEQMMGI
jgi:hypothetical protein